MSISNTTTPPMKTRDVYHLDSCAECKGVDDRRYMIEVAFMKFVHSGCIVRYFHGDETPLLMLPAKEIRKLRIADVSRDTVHKLLVVLDAREALKGDAT